MLRIGFEQRKLFVGTDAYGGRKLPVSFPKTFIRLVSQKLERLCPSVFVVGSGFLHEVVETAGAGVFLDAEIDRLRPTVVVEPQK